MKDSERQCFLISYSGDVVERVVDARRVPKMIRHEKVNYDLISDGGSYELLYVERQNPSLRLPAGRPPAATG
jgi:hypothetical protein